MSDQTETKKARRTVLTFIYATEVEKGPRIALISSEVKESTVDAAWRRVAAANNIKAQAFLGAIRGEKELLENQLRRPTYKELQQQLSALQAQQ